MWVFLNYRGNPGHWRRQGVKTSKNESIQMRIDVNVFFLQKKEMKNFSGMSDQNTFALSLSDNIALTDVTDVLFSRLI